MDSGEQEGRSRLSPCFPQASCKGTGSYASPLDAHGLEGLLVVEDASVLQLYRGSLLPVGLVCGAGGFTVQEYAMHIPRFLPVSCDRQAAVSRLTLGMLFPFTASGFLPRTIQAS